MFSRNLICTVFLLHGRGGSPESPKMKALRSECQALGFPVLVPDFTAVEEPEKRVAMLQPLLSSVEGPVVLAGSSMGGYVAVRASQSYDVAGLFLISPALYLPHYPACDLTPKAASVVIVHGLHDEVVPYQNSVAFSKAHAAELHGLAGDHSLQDVTPAVARLFRNFLENFRVTT